MIALMLLAAALTVGPVEIVPSDILDGRAIASPSGKPVVMLTLKPAAVARIALQKDATVLIDGQPVIARRKNNTIEIDGPADFPAADALALRLSGKSPLDSTDE